jgi:hypothetical protein
LPGALEIAENKPPWRFSLQHIELVTEHQDLRFSEARDRKSPMKVHQISLSKSPMKRTIARFGALR